MINNYNLKKIKSSWDMNEIYSIKFMPLSFYIS